MTLQAYLRVLRERWKLIVSLLLLGIASATALTALSAKTYQASTQVFVSSTGSADPAQAYQGAAYAQVQVETYASIVTSPDILRLVRRDLGTRLTDADLKSRITADSPTGKSLVNIHVTGADASDTAAICNSVSRAFVTVVQQYAVPRGSSNSTVKLYVTDPATAPTDAISPDPARNFVIGAILGLLLGVALAVVRDIIDNRLKSAEELARATGSPGMGVIVDDAKSTRHPIASRGGNQSVRAENFRQLRANLQFANIDSHPRVIAVASSVPAEGKTSVAINLASTLAEAGFSVCLVDADLRRPTVAKVLGLLSPVGLTNVLIQQMEVDEALQQVGVNFFVLSSGPTPPNPSEVLASDQTRNVISTLLVRFDYIILDTAPLLPVADGAEVAALSDGVLLVARYRETTDAQARRASESLARVDAKLIGTVLNRVPSRKRGEYGYSYYRAENDKRPPSPRGRGRRKGERDASRSRSTREALVDAQ